MKSVALSSAIGLVLAIGFDLAPAQAQFSRTYVSAASGNDANDCSSKPCRSFQRAHNQTYPDGEITVLDPGEYFPMIISKSISIVHDGDGEAGIQVSQGATGVTVNAPAAGYVNLRGVTIQGTGIGTGLRFNTGFSLTIQNCVIRNHTGDGIAFFPSASGGASSLSVSNTLVADNGGHAIHISPTASGVAAKVALSQVEAYTNSQDGLLVSGNGSTGTINVSVADSVFGNGGTGIVVASGSGAVSSVVLARSLVANNVTGLFATGANATLRIGDSTVTGNATSWLAAASGTLRSYGDNDIDGNGDGDPAPTPIPRK